MNEKYFNWYAVCGIGVALFVWYWIFGANVSDESVRAERVRNNIQVVEEYQHNAFERLEAVESGLAESVAEVEIIRNKTDRIADRIETGEGGLAESSKLIDRGEEILRGIRKRNESEIKN